MDTEKRNKIIEKVRKLYALAEGTDSQEEAESAVLMAQSILHEYNLTLTEADLQEKDGKKCFEHVQDTGTRHHSAWVAILANNIADAFDSKIIFGTRYINNKKIPYIRFIGVEPDVSLATHTFYYLSGVAIRHKDRNKTSSQLNHWKIGFADAVGRRLIAYANTKKQETPQTTALVICKDEIVSDYMSKNHPNLRQSKVFMPNLDAMAYKEGILAGEKVPLSRPINEAGTCFGSLTA
ncbi:MAG: DUF2786 domain-containing protein [Desulfovibrionaceae bacterium]